MSTAIVTGAASGMGHATAARLLERGWDVLGLDVRQPTDNPDTGRLTSIQVDITDRAAVGACLTEAMSSRSDGVGLVVNVAGIYPPTTLDSFTDELYRQIFDVNVLGTLNVIAEAKRFMAPSAAVVNFASVDAFAVSPGQLLYGASKAAVVMITKALALELAPIGIRVNAIAPGWVNTPGNAATGRMEAAAHGIPLGRVAQPDEIAEWVLTLAGSAAGFMTGETIVLSGGDVIR